MNVYTRAQLMADGIGSSTIDRRVAKGTLHRILPSIYSTTPPTYAMRCEAVLLWKPDAVLSHDSAAFLWGLLDPEPALVHATLPPNGTTRGPDWVKLHRRSLPDHRRLGEFRIVPIEHAILDVATTLSRSMFEAVIDAALSKVVSWRSLAQLCDRASGKSGMRMLREQLRRACPNTLSEPERMVARALTARNFYMEINGAVGPYYGDLVDRRARVVVEIDGRKFHSEPTVFTSDRDRQNDMVLDGWTVLRYSAARVYADVDAVAEHIIAAVRRRRSLNRG